MGKNIKKGSPGRRNRRSRGKSPDRGNNLGRRKSTGKAKRRGRGKSPGRGNSTGRGNSNVREEGMVQCGWNKDSKTDKTPARRQQVLCARLGPCPTEGGRRNAPQR